MDDHFGVRNDRHTCSIKCFWWLAAGLVVWQKTGDCTKAHGIQWSMSDIEISQHLSGRGRDLPRFEPHEQSLIEERERIQNGTHKHPTGKHHEHLGSSTCEKCRSRHLLHAYTAKRTCHAPSGLQKGNEKSQGRPVLSRTCFCVTRIQRLRELFGFFRGISETSQEPKHTNGPKTEHEQHHSKVENE